MILLGMTIVADVRSVMWLGGKKAMTLTHCRRSQTREAGICLSCAAVARLVAVAVEKRH